MSVRNVTIHLSPERLRMLVDLIGDEVGAHRMTAQNMPRTSASADAARKAGRAHLDLLKHVSPDAYTKAVEFHGRPATWHNGDRARGAWSR